MMTLMPLNWEETIMHHGDQQRQPVSGREKFGEPSLPPRSSTSRTAAISAAAYSGPPIPSRIRGLPASRPAAISQLGLSGIGEQQDEEEDRGQRLRRRASSASHSGVPRLIAQP